MRSVTAWDLTKLHKPPSTVNGKVSPQSHPSTWREFSACPDSAFFYVFWSSQLETRSWILLSGCLVAGWWRLSGSEFGLRWNLSLTRFFTFNFSAAVQFSQAVALKTDTQLSPIQHTVTILQHPLITWPVQLLMKKQCPDILSNTCFWLMENIDLSFCVCLY